MLASSSCETKCDRLISYWFEHDSRLDRGLLDELGRLRATGLQVHFATNQEHMRARYLMGPLGLAEHVDNIQYSARLGARKPGPDFFHAAARRVRLPPEDLLLIDDTPDNVRGAVAADWKAVLWTNGKSLAGTLDALLSS